MREGNQEPHRGKNLKELGPAAEWSSEVENKLREFLRPGIETEVVKILFYWLAAEEFGVWDMFKDDVENFDKGDLDFSEDIVRHIPAHIYAEVRTRYGLPKMDLGIAFWFHKLDRASRALFDEMSKLHCNSEKERKNLTAMKKELPLYLENVFGKLDRNTTINEIVKKGYKLDLEFGGPEGLLGPGNRYSFFVFLLPFYRDEDGQSLMPAYRRRVEFLWFFEANFRPQKKVETNQQTSTSVPLTEPGQSNTEPALDIESILKLDAAKAVQAMYHQRIDPFSLAIEQKLALMQQLAGPDSGLLIGAGDDRRNFILERTMRGLIYHKGQLAPEHVEKLKTILGPNSPLEKEFFPPIKEARDKLWQILEGSS